MSEWVTADTPLTHSLTHSLHWASVTHCTTTPSVHFGSFSLRQRTLSVQPQHCSLKHYQRPKSVYVHASMYTPYTVHRTPYIDAVPFTPSLTRPPSFPLIMQPYSTSTIHPFIWCSFCVLLRCSVVSRSLPHSPTHSPTHLLTRSRYCPSIMQPYSTSISVQSSAAPFPHSLNYSITCWRSRPLIMQQYSTLSTPSFVVSTDATLH